jgi:hypothetical protein
MIKKQLFSVMFFLLFFANLFAQSTDNKPLKISPYAGLSLPQGDFKDLNDNGSVFGLSVDKYLNSKFALGFDINFQSNDFKNPLDFSSLSSAFSVVNNDINKWKATSITFGPTYKIGKKKINTELYLKGGFSTIKVPSQSSTFSGGGIQDINILELKEESKSSFGLTSGIRFNYNISDRFSLFVNPQYVFSGSEIEIFKKDISPDISNNPDLLLQDGGKICFVKPSYLNLNAGIKFSFGGKSDNNTDESVNRNLPICVINFDSIECRGPNQIIRLTSTWFGQNASDIIDIKIFNGSILVSSGNLISNNNIPLGAASGTFTHALTVSGFAGSVLRAEITINDVNGVLACSSPSNDYESPTCPTDPCDFEIDTTNFTCDMNSVTFSATSSWTNVLAGTVIDIVGSQGSNNVPLTFSPNNIPLTLSGTGTVSGSTNHNITISNSYLGQSITIIMKMTDPSTGQVTSCGGLDLIVPPCTNETCDLVEIEASCNNEKPFMAFSVDWANYINFNNYSIYLDALDQSGNPVAWFSVAFPPSVLTAPSGSQLFNMNLMPQYAGQTLTIRLKICQTASNGVKHCCYSGLKIEIPKCCEVCSDITLDDTTNVNQNNALIFKVKGNLNPVSPSSSPVKKIIAQLEHISFSDRSTPSTPAPNHEFIGGWFASGAGNFTPNLKGSLLNNRSNLLEVDVNATTATNMSFFLNIDNYSNKIVEEYRIKLTIFKQDGTYCEKDMYYNRWLDFWTNFINNN